MIINVEGDILMSKAGAIAHGVAPNDDFQHGCSQSLRENWPAMYKDFRHFCHTSHPDSGGLWTWHGVGGVTIINLFTQDGAYEQGSKPGKAKLKHVGHALKALKKELKKLDVKSLAITKLGTGAGGLDWDDVKPVLEEKLGDLEIPVYVYETYKSGVQAKEDK